MRLSMSLLSGAVALSFCSTVFANINDSASEVLNNHDGVSSLVMLIQAHEVASAVYAAYDLGVRKLEQSRDVYNASKSHLNKNDHFTKQENNRFSVNSGLAHKFTPSTSLPDWENLGAVHYLTTGVYFKETTSNPVATQGGYIVFQMNEAVIHDSTNFTCWTNLDAGLNLNTAQDRDYSEGAAIGGKRRIVIIPAVVDLVVIPGTATSKDAVAIAAVRFVTPFKIRYTA